MQSIIVDATLKLEVSSATNPSGRVENCEANTTTAANVTADRSGLFYCPVVSREVGIKELMCQHNCDHRRRI